MEALKSVVEDNLTLSYCVAAGVAIASTVVALKLLRKGPSKASDLLEGPPDTVILFQIARGPNAPSMSPFPVKLETYLRMAKIPYQNDLSGIMSKKGKTPWMAYNGEAVADSQFCIEHLNAKRGIDLNKDLTPEERAIAKSIQIMVDEHLYWCLVFFRWVYDTEKKVVKRAFNFGFLQFFILRYAVRMIRSQLHGQGMGRHTPEEIQHILMSDLTYLSTFLGTKSFIMGEKPCETDCSIFGMLTQLVWHQEDEILGKIIQDKFPNLHKYALRMKDTFWPDWDDCTLKTNK